MNPLCLLTTTTSVEDQPAAASAPSGSSAVASQAADHVSDGCEPDDSATVNAMVRFVTLCLCMLILMLFADCYRLYRG